MQPHGDPIKWSFYGILPQSTQSLILTLPGTSTNYAFQPNDILFLTSYVEAAQGAAESSGQPWLITLLGPGETSTAVNATNALLTGGSLTSGAKSWSDASFSEAIAGVQGIIPTIIGLPGGGSGATIIVGTGFVVHAPGLTRPAFMNSQVPTG